ncbi:MAG: hypothetical protein Q8O06_03175 [Acetobacterium sp.]|nr:hypothetical protein [Acetobacterium sp.]
MTKNIKIAPGPERAKSWVYTVINPIEDGILYENNLLKDFKITWQWRTKKTEFIRQCSDYVNTSYFRNYIDFSGTQYGKMLMKQMKIHDEYVVKLNSKATEAAKALKDDVTFTDLVITNLRDYRVSNVNDPYGSLKAEEFYTVIVEYLINNIDELPEHYTTSKFWNLYKASFYAIRNGDRENLKHNYSELENIIKELFNYNESFLLYILKIRKEICDKYSIPADYTSLTSAPSGSYSDFNR